MTKSVKPWLELGAMKNEKKIEYNVFIYFFEPFVNALFCHLYAPP